MELVGSFFRRSRPETILGVGSTSQDANTPDYKSTKYFKSQNLERSQFGTDVIFWLKWWPDEIVTFLDILERGYIDFISCFEMADSFDSPLKNALFYMMQKPYSDGPDISKFIQHGDHFVPARYVSVMIAEDNCRMYDLEQRDRSKNEQKHFLLVNALSELLQQTPIQYECYKLEAKQEAELRRYLIIYTTRKCYATVDDLLRSVLQSIFKNFHFTDNLMFILEELIIEFKGIINKQIRYIDEKLFNKVFILQDLLNYAVRRMRQCNAVFNEVILTSEDTPSTLYTYKYFKELAIIHSKKVGLAESGVTEMKIEEDFAKRDQELRTLAPRYFLSNGFSDVKPNTPRDPKNSPRDPKNSPRNSPKNSPRFPDNKLSSTDLDIKTPELETRGFKTCEPGIDSFLMSESAFAVSLDGLDCGKKLTRSHRRKVTAE